MLGVNKVVIGDADLLVALAYKNDSNHERAVKITEKLLERLYGIKFPNTAILEAITALKRGLNKPDLAEKINHQYQQGAFDVIYVDASIQLEASKIFNQVVSKKNTIFDAIVMATAIIQKADGIASFDGWYRKKGIKLMEEII